MSVLAFMRSATVLWSILAWPRGLACAHAGHSKIVALRASAQTIAVMMHFPPNDRRQPIIVASLTHATPNDAETAFPLQLLRFSSCEESVRVNSYEASCSA
jgi:hypothetical protein